MPTCADPPPSPLLLPPSHARRCKLILAFDEGEEEEDPNTPSTSSPSPPLSSSSRGAAELRQRQAPLSEELRRLLREADSSPVFSWLLKSLLHGHGGSGLGVAAEVGRRHTATTTKHALPCLPTQARPSPALFEWPSYTSFRS